MRDPHSTNRHQIFRMQSILVALCIYAACVVGSLVQPTYGQSKLVPLSASGERAEMFSLERAIDYKVWRSSNELRFAKVLGLTGAP